MSGTSSRMLELLSLLQLPRDWSGHVLAERLGVTPRTVRRDVDRLRELGYRVHASKGPDGGYRLVAGDALPPLRFDDEQAIAIAIALGRASGTGVQIDEAAQRALGTVRQVMPSRLRHRIDTMRFVDDAEPPALAPEVLEAVSAATLQHRTLRFGYRDEDGPSRRTQPHAVLARGGLWYLVAWDLEREDWRIFRLDRMSPRSPSGAAFEPKPIPMGSAAAFVAARSKGAADEDHWPCIGEVEIDLPALEVARWLGDGEIDVVDPHTSRLRLGSWSWTGVLATILRLDADFRILGPAELTTAARSLAHRVQDASEPRMGEAV